MSTYAVAARPRNAVVVLGDVDHGKTTLVKALRSAHGRSSEVAIDLIDPWAYEDAVVRLATDGYPARVALLVVSAAIGWTPRSALFLRIVWMRNYRSIVVALTFTDLVEDAVVRELAETVSHQLVQTGFADGEVIALGGCSLSKEKRSLDRCMAALVDAVNPSGTPRARR